MVTINRPHFLLISDTTDYEPHDGGRRGHWQFVLESTDSRQRASAAADEPDTSGERLQLLSVLRGLEALDQPSRVTLITTSRYVTRGIRFGLEAWRQSGWRWERFGSMVPIKNQDLWQRLDQALQVHSVQPRCVRLDAPETDVRRPHFAAVKPRAQTKPLRRSASSVRGRYRRFAAWWQEMTREFVPHWNLVRN